MRWDFDNSGMGIPEKGEPIEGTVLENGKRVKGGAEIQEGRVRNSPAGTRLRREASCPILRSGGVVDCC